MKKDELIVSYDPDRDEQLLMSKGKGFKMPTTKEGVGEMVLNDLDIICMGLAGIIRTAEQNEVMPIQQLMERVNKNLGEFVFDTKSEGMFVEDYEKETGKELNKKDK